jgi:AbrB family looped-hinge helix DNA binding protein
MIFHGYVGVQARGVITLPAAVRRRLRLDEVGAQVELTERADGVLELRPAPPVAPGQAWFWAQRWQEREREIAAHVAAGEVTVHEDLDALLEHLDALADDTLGA